MVTEERELMIENKIVELAKLLDEEHGVNDEFYAVLIRAINHHSELIGEQQ